MKKVIQTVDSVAKVLGIFGSDLILLSLHIKNKSLESAGTFDWRSNFFHGSSGLGLTVFLYLTTVRNVLWGHC